MRKYSICVADAASGDRPRSAANLTSIRQDLDTKALLTCENASEAVHPKGADQMCRTGDLEDVYAVQKHDRDTCRSCAE